MSTPGSDAVFAGSIPELYDTQLVPLIFEPYAADLARRIAALAPSRVLETAAGTGVVTRALARALPASTELVATDLNQPMLDHAAAIGTARPVTWQKADAMQLPFDDASFDVVACQFGAMFFPDKARAFAEARRVLRPGGTLVFNVWDRIEENEFADVVTDALAVVFPADPPRFMARTPHGYSDRQAIATDLANGRLQRATAHRDDRRAQPRGVRRMRRRSPTARARRCATRSRPGPVPRSPRRRRRAKPPSPRRFGAGPVDGKIQAHVVLVDR